MLKKSAFILLLFIFAFPAFSQTIYSVDNEGVWQFRYLSGRTSSLYENRLINQLAVTYRKIPERAGYDFHFNYNVSLTYGYGNDLDIVFNIEPHRCTGDVFMFDFDLSPVLFPSLASFKIDIEHPVDGLLTGFAWKNIPLDSLKSGFIAGRFADSLWKEGCSVNVSYSNFTFDELSYAQTERELFNLREYVAASSLADTLEKRIRKARVSKHTAVDAFVMSVFAHKASGLLKEANAIKSILLPGKDPAGLEEKLRIALYRTVELDKYLLNDGITVAGYGNVYKQFSKRYIADLQGALRLSQQVDYYSSPYFYRLFSNGITASQLNQYKKHINQFALTKSFGQPDLALLSREVASEYLKAANGLIEKDKYSEAVDLLAAGVQLCKLIPEVAVPEKLSNRLMEARSGLTAAYVRVVEKALKNNLPGIAEKYLEEAESYVRKYGLEGEEATGLTSLYQQMADIHIKAAATALQTDGYPLALAELDKAYTISQNRAGIILGAGYNSGLKKAVGGSFTEMIRKVKSLLNSGDYTGAGSKMEEAMAFASYYQIYQPDMKMTDSLTFVIAKSKYFGLIELAQKEWQANQREKFINIMIDANQQARFAGIDHGIGFDTLVSGGVVACLSDLYSAGRYRIWAGEPEEALAISQQAAQYSAIFDIADVAVLKNLHEELLQLADESLCSRVRGILESMIGQADDLLKNNRFTPASKVIFETREFIYSNYYCGLTTRELNAITEKYKNPIRWNELHQSALTLIAEGNFNEGVSKLNEAESLYHQYKLEDFGLSNSGLYELAAASGEPPLLYYTAEYYLSRRSPDKALELLEKLRIAGVGIYESADLQESIAIGLAVRDSDETDEVNLKMMLRLYTNGNRWYKRFSEVYRDQILNHKI